MKASAEGARWVWAGAVSLLAWALLRWLAPGPAIPWTEEMLGAAEAMDRAIGVVSAYCLEEGVSLDRAADPNGTCLVGPEVSELFTTLGQVEAKRTTVQPDMSGLVAHLLTEAGVSRGDTVAIGASGSFPGLMIATLTAVEALGAVPVAILSLGASSFGATRPDFHLLDLQELLLEEGVVLTPPVAVSLGGGEDVGREFEIEFRDRLLTEILTDPVPLLLEPDLPSNVSTRMALYGSPAAFVNVGGSHANLGISPRILDVPPGLVRGLESSSDLPPVGERGVLFEMASRGVPVIHLLHVRGLALRYGLSWDPVPLPGPGTTSLRDQTRGKGFVFWALSAGYLAALAFVALWGKGRNRTGPEIRAHSSP